MKATFECPICGADVPTNALSCPGCGADEHTGLHDTDGPSYLADAEENFDYDAFIDKEFGQSRPRSGKERIIAAIAFVLIIAFVVTWVFFI